jgi:major membrane immunogen (membrane-anchored lipoprotein)
MKKINLLTISCISALAISSCSPSAHVKGQMDTGSETFKGEIKQYKSKRGRMEIEMVESKVICDGKFTKAKSSMAKGILRCDDGRTGEYRFEGRRDGHGFGSLDGQRFRFEFDR